MPTARSAFTARSVFTAQRARIFRTIQIRKMHGEFHWPSRSNAKDGNIVGIHTAHMPAIPPAIAAARHPAGPALSIQQAGGCAAPSRAVEYCGTRQRRPPRKSH